MKLTSPSQGLLYALVPERYDDLHIAISAKGLKNRIIEKITTLLHKKQFHVQWKINFKFILLFGSSSSNNTNETYINFCLVFCSSSASMNITKIIILQHTHVDWKCMFMCEWFGEENRNLTIISYHSPYVFSHSLRKIYSFQ